MKWIFRRDRIAMCVLAGSATLAQAQILPPSPADSAAAESPAAESTSPTTVDTTTSSPATDQQDHTDESTSTEERSVTEIRKSTRAVLREEALATDGTPSHLQAVGDLIHLHTEAVAHSTFQEGFALRETRTQIQGRLVRVERDIRQKFDAPRKPISVAAKPPLAQFGNNPRNLGQFGGGAGPLGGGQFGGGAGQFGGGQPGIAGQLPDFGPDLADLIQRVIDPTTWDVNGGPGSIIYFPPVRALIISAPSEVHHNLADVLGQMRNAP